MESNMVENDLNNISWADQMNSIVTDFFERNFPGFSVLKKTSNSPYWGLKYKKDDTVVEIGGDIGFYVNVYIDQSKFPLWQFDKSVNDFLDTTPENILYQLNVLTRFLKKDNDDLR